MWPEARTNSLSVKEILYWQRHTMNMKYEVVAQELQSSQIEGAHPTDYLNFYWQTKINCISILRYRMSLWAEHIGAIESRFKVPDDLDCVRRVNDIAERNWRRYTTEEFTRLQGHVIKYPVDIDLNGRATSLPGFEKFPDFVGQIS
ncbi:hypothetical protein ACS0TY_036753 [Phlomoides rotata]